MSTAKFSEGREWEDATGGQDASPCQVAERASVPKIKIFDTNSRP